MRHFLDRHPRVLVEAAVVERLRRAGDVPLHPRLASAALVASPAGRRALATILDEYLDVATRSRVPMIAFAPTWRADRDRVLASGLPDTLNRDAVGFARDVLARRPRPGPEVLLGALVGCRGDAYRPEEALTAEAAAGFHAWQADRLAEAGADFLLGATLPALSEAIGVARAMAATGLDFVISFVLGADGRLLDGTTLDDAVRAIDDDGSGAAQGFAVNCSHPSFVPSERLAPDVRGRLVLIQANAAAIDPRALDGAHRLRADDVGAWAEAMVRIQRTTGVRALGGCCGTDARHLRAIVDAWRAEDGPTG